MRCFFFLVVQFLPVVLHSLLLLWHFPLSVTWCYNRQSLIILSLIGKFHPAILSKHFTVAPWLLCLVVGIRWIKMPCARKNLQKCHLPRKWNFCVLYEKLELQRKNKNFFFLVFTRFHLVVWNLVFVFHIVMINLLVVMIEPMCFLVG